jgi:2-dehydropantoate 2-reductase
VIEDFMKICIYGAGAIGGYLGVQLLRAGADVSLVARGAHLAAMRAHGLKPLIGDEECVVQPRWPVDGGSDAGARYGIGAGCTARQNRGSV